MDYDILNALEELVGADKHNEEIDLPGGAFQGFPELSDGP